MKKNLHISRFEPFREPFGKTFNEPFNEPFGKSFGKPFGQSYEQVMQETTEKPKNIWLSFAELFCLITLGMSMLAFFPS